MYGNVTDNKIQFDSQGVEVEITDAYDLFTENQLLILSENYYLWHRNCLALFENRYLAAYSTSFNTFFLFDCQNDLAVNMKIQDIPVEAVDGGWYADEDNGSIGVRAVYNASREDVIIYTGDKQLVEYNPVNGEEIAAFETQHYVFNILQMGDHLVVIEKEDGLYYIEIVGWSDLEEIHIKTEADQMRVGETQQLSIDNGRMYTLQGTWSSSDSYVVSVNSNGRITAWKEGTAVITVTALDEAYTAECTITVTASDTVTPDQNIITLQNSCYSYNSSDNNYQIWSSEVNSYLVENTDGTLTRVEYLWDQGILVETYSEDYKLTDSRMLDLELEYFGGFFSGADYNFLVFGQFNEEEEDTFEVMRVVKYSKDWERLEQASAYGEDTYVPFEAGSLRMAENAGELYIHTCHKMYASSDGLHHQSNMSFVLNQESMEIEREFGSAYTSHSFNQFVQTNGTYIYFVDHGDAYSRAISISSFLRCEWEGYVGYSNEEYTETLQICGETGANATGVSIGGFELSADNCLIVGNSVDQSDPETYSAFSQRNIFLTVTDQALSSTNLIWLTEYTEDDNISTYTPQLVKLNDDQFLIMWEEYHGDTGRQWLRAVTVDGDGTRTSDIEKINLSLSDCQPIVTSDGLVKWYVTEGETLNIYCINPYDLASIQKIVYGDADEDGEVTAKDVVLMKRYLAGWWVELFEEAGDVDLSGTLDLKDVTLLKRYLAGWDVVLGS